MYVTELPCSKPQDYQEFSSNHYLRIVNTYATYAAAKAACEAEGSTLIILNSDAKLDWLKASASGTYYWIGLENTLGGSCSDQTCTGYLQWADGSSFDFNDATISSVNGARTEFEIYKTGTSIRFQIYTGSNPYFCEFKC